MPRKKKQVTGSRNVARTFVFGPAPILEGEDEKAYNELLECISGAVGPKGFIEEMWVYDITNKTWEIIRYRKYTAGLIKAAVPAALEEALEPITLKLIEDESPDAAFIERQRGLFGGQTAIKKLMSDWLVGKSDIVEWVDNTLSHVGLTMEDINARAMRHVIDDIKTLDGLLWRLETSRDAMLQQIERRRATFAERLRHTARDAEEGEFKKADIKIIPPPADDEAA